jgi:holin-like protein
LSVEPFCKRACRVILPEINDLVEDSNVGLLFFTFLGLMREPHRRSIFAEWGGPKPVRGRRQPALRQRGKAMGGLDMLMALLVLIGCQLAGELLRSALALPVPGPVIGMFMLAAVLAFRSRATKTTGNGFSPTLERTAETLIGSMGLLFVPAGVGIISEAELLRQEWLPIVAALFGSTILGLLVTGLVMHWASRPRQERTAATFGTIPSHQGSHP